MAQITREVLEGVLDYPRDITEAIAPHAHRFGYRPGDGVALFDEFLRRAGSREREALLAEAHRS